MITILQGDCLEKLRELPECSVHCCVTSPPYWGLRDYGVAGQIGLEKTPEEYVAKMVEVFHEAKRVLREDGTLWLNLGDSYASDTKGSGGPSVKQLSNAGSFHNVSQRLNHGLKPKDLVGIPWRVAFALQADGWWLRSDIIWSKPNPMPESVTDRPTKSHEYIFLLAKSERYFYDAEAIKEPLASDPETWGRHSNKDPGLCAVNPRAMFGPDRGGRDGTEWGNGGTRNKRTVWAVGTDPYPEAHFATYPPDLIKPCILAGTSAKGCCPHCGAPRERVVEKCKEQSQREPRGKAITSPRHDGSTWNENNGRGFNETAANTIGWEPGCDCGHGRLQPCTVLDPFGGSGTTGQVALELGRKAILIELNAKYIRLIEERTNVTPGLQLA